MKKFILAVAVVVLGAQAAEAGCFGAAARAERQAARAERRASGKTIVAQVATNTVTKVRAVAQLPLKLLSATCTNCK